MLPSLLGVFFFRRHECGDAGAPLADETSASVPATWGDGMIGCATLALRSIVSALAVRSHGDATPADRSRGPTNRGGFSHFQQVLKLVHRRLYRRHSFV